MGVSQLGGDVELEVLRVLDGGVAQLDTEAAALLECLLQQQGLQDGIQLLLNVLKQHLVWTEMGQITGKTFSFKVQERLNLYNNHTCTHTHTHKHTHT